MDPIDDILKRYPPRREYLLPILHDLQDAHRGRFLEESHLIKVAAHFKINLAVVKGVADYYSMLSTKARGRHLLHVCGSIICRHAGSRDLHQKLKAYYQDQTAISIHRCECLGQCHDAPSVLLDQEFLSGASTENLIQLINQRIRKDD